MACIIAPAVLSMRRDRLVRLERTAQLHGVQAAVCRLSTSLVAVVVVVAVDVAQCWHQHASCSLRLRHRGVHSWTFSPGFQRRRVVAVACVLRSAECGLLATIVAEGAGGWHTGHPSCLQVTLMSCSRVHQAEYLTRQRRRVVRTVWPLLCTRHAGDCSALPPISGKPTLVSVPLAACVIEFPNLAQ
jgi:hypothetical protein